ncbi:MAG: polyprenyl synthetase family protein [Armatimonadota bacterium]
MSAPTILEQLRSYTEAVEHEIAEVIRLAATEEARGLYRMLEYHLGWVDADGTPVAEGYRQAFAGKRLRPALCLLFCQLAGGDWQSAGPAAAAVELIHSFSLIHDDVEDGDETRHHRPTVWAVWGVNHAVNSGSSTQALVYASALRCSARGIPDSTVLAVVNELTEAVLRMTEGQYLDMRLEGGRIPDASIHDVMVRGKTCALLSAACGIGWLLGDKTGDASRLAQVRAFGEALGLAFQARDDILGTWGDASVTGKPVGSDLLRRKKTLPVVLAYQAANGEQRRWMERFFGRRPSPGAATAMLELMEALGAKEAAQREAERLAAEASARLDALRPSEGDEQRSTAYYRIQLIVNFVLERNR